MLQTILNDRKQLLEAIESKKSELQELEKQRMIFSNNLTHQISSLELIGKSCYFYDTSENNNLFVYDKFQKESFRDKQGYFDLDYFDVLTGKELQDLFSSNKYFFIKRENFDKQDFENISGIRFKKDSVYLVLTKYNLEKITRSEVENIAMELRDISQYVLVYLK